MLRRFLWVPASVALLAFVVWRTRPWELAEAGLPLDPLVLAAVVLLNAAVVALWAIRSSSLMAGIGHPLPFSALVPLVSFANTISNLTPASAGEVMRVVILRNRYGVPVGRSTAVILVERLWAIGIMAVTAGVAAVIAFGRPSEPVAVALVLVGVAGSYVPAVAYGAGLRPGRLLERWTDRPAGATDDGRSGAMDDGSSATDVRPRQSRLRRATGALVELDRTLATLMADRTRAIVFVTSTWLIFVGYALQLALLLQMLGSPVSLEVAWAALGLATVAGVLSALPFGLGAADVVLSIVLVGLGVAPAVTGFAILLLRATATLPLGIAGAAAWAALGGRSSRPEPEPDLKETARWP